MNPGTMAAIGLAGLISLPAAAAQVPRGPDFQVGLGLALRDVHDQSFAAASGAHGLGRVLVPLRPRWSLVGELALSAFPTTRAAVPASGPCPVGTLCAQQPLTAPGPRILSLNLGIQHRYPMGPVAVLLTGLAGHSWVGHPEPGSASTAFGLGAALGLGFPGSRHVRPMLEVRTVRLMQSRADPRWVSGLALGMAIE